MTPSSETWSVCLSVAMAAAMISIQLPTRLLRELDIPRPSWAWYCGYLITALATTQIAYSSLSIPTVVIAGAVGLLISASVAIAWYDASFLIIPDVLPIMLVIAALCLNFAAERQLSLLTAVLCAGLLASLMWGWRKATGKEAMGLGDVKLAGAFGLMLSPQQGAWMLAASALSAAAWTIIIQKLHPKSTQPLIPYGLFLAIIGCGMVLAIHP